MKKTAFFLVALFLSTVVASSQTIHFELKNGNVISVSSKDLKSADVGLPKREALELTNHKVSIDQAPAITLMDCDEYITNQRIKAFSPKTQASNLFSHDYYTVQFETPYGYTSELVADDNGYVPTSWGISFGLYGNIDYSPDYHKIGIIVNEYLTHGALTLKSSVEGSIDIRYSNIIQEPVYYLTGNFNDWQISDDFKFSYPSGNVYDGRSFSFNLPVTKNGIIKARIVPASAVTGKGYDASKAWGRDRQHGINEGEEETPFTLAQGNDAEDILFMTGGEDCLFNLQTNFIFKTCTVTSCTFTDIYKRCYSSLGFINAQKDPNVSSDIEGSYGTCDIIRQLFNLNELPSDNAICCWGDNGIHELNTSMPTASCPMAYDLYCRLQKNVDYCNKYLALDSQSMMAAEVRCLRALNNYYLLDLFGNVPVALRANDARSSTMQRTDFFRYIESELLDIESLLAAPRAKSSSYVDYGKVDKATAWLLLSRLYLNAEVYTGIARWQEAKSYAQKVIDSPYKLAADYRHLFMGDNGENGASIEAILPIAFDSNNAKSWGGTTFLIASTHKGYDDMPSSGITENWEGNRARPTLVDKFSGYDDRYLFWSIDRTKDIYEVGRFENGYSVTKFTNISTSGSTVMPQFSNTDYFLLRSAEAYLNAAEADLRTGNSSAALATVNTLRSRANAAPLTKLSLLDIADEWAREFYFEGRRRTDLIRLGLYTSADYLWQWKGDVYEGAAIDKHYEIYPIPIQILDANPNAIQNPGY